MHLYFDLQESKVEIRKQFHQEAHSKIKGPMKLNVRRRSSDKYRCFRAHMAVK